MIKSNIPKRLLIILLVLLIGVGVIVRSVETINKNYIFGFDHGREYLITREIVVEHHLRLIGESLGAGSAGIQGIFHGPGFYYFLAIPFILFNGDPYGGIVLMLLFGLAALLLVFLLGKKIFGASEGLVMTVLTALSPPLIAQSRAIWNSFPSTFFILLSFYFTYLINKNRLYVFPAAFFAGFVYNFEFAIAVPLTLSLVIYSLAFFKKKDLKAYLYLLLGFIFAYSPMILFEIRHNFMAVRGVINYFITPKNNESSLSFLQNQFDHLGSFIFNIADSFPNRDLLPSFTLLILISTGFVVLLKKEKRQDVKNFLYYLLILPIATFISFSFLRNAVYQYYLFHLVLVYIIIFSYILISSYRHRMYGIFAVFGVIFIMYSATSVPVFFKTFLYDIKDYGGDAKIKGKVDAIDYIYNDAKNKEFGLLVFSPPVYTYPYDYIMYWRGKEKYGYIPPAEKKKEFYLLMEVDPSKPWSYKGWLETVIKDGKVVNEIVLPSGIIIQKRVMQ